MAPPVRGRDPQLETLVERLQQLRSGTGSVVVIEGAPGLGKTRLLQESVAIAAQMGLRSGHGMADPIDSVVELAPLLEALFEGDQPLLERTALSSRHAAPEQRFWLLQDIEALIEKAALDHELLICLDDLHWADTGTAAALRSLPQRLARHPVTWFLTTRLGQGSTQVRAAIAELARGGADVLRLEPLEVGAVAQVVTDMLRAEPDQSLLRTVERINGNPLLLVELVRGLEEEGMVAVADGRATLVEDRVPVRMSDDMRDRLSLLPKEAERVAVAASSLGRRFTVADLGTLSGLGVPELLEPLQTLMQADLLVDYEGRLAFRHDLVRDAVRASIPPAVRRAMDRRSADVLIARGALPVEVATQLAASAEPGDDVAIATLLEAAEALGVTDPAASAELAERALRLTSTRHRLRGPLVARRAISLFAAGLGSEAKQFADTALRQALPAADEAQVRLSIASMFVLSPDVRADNARQALGLPGLPADLRAWLTSLVLHNLVVAGRTDEALKASPEVHATVDASDSREARFAAELAQAGLDYQQFLFESALDRLRGADHTGTTEDVRQRLARYFGCWPLLALDRFDEAREVADTGILDAERDRQNWALHIFETWKGLQALQSGDLADAAVAFEGRFSPADAHLVVGIIDAAGVAGTGRLRLHMGDRRGAREIAEIARIMLNATAPSIRQHAAWFLASYAMAEGDAEAAHRMLCALGEPERLALFPCFPHDIANDPQLVRIAAAVGDEELVDGIVNDVERRRRLNPTVASFAASAAHVRGLARGARADLETAVALFGRTPRRPALASAAEDLGVLCLREGDMTAAVTALDTALSLTVDMGAAWDAARVRKRLRRLGVRRRVVTTRGPLTGWASLTPAEAQVAQLVTEGRTNREIAEQLFVSPHTVSAHLRHVFDKMGLRSRVDLTRAVSDHSPSEPIQR